MSTFSNGARPWRPALLALTAALTVVAATAQAKSHALVATVPQVDLARYVGT